MISTAVIGGNGFIGKNLIEYFSHKHKLIIIDNNIDSNNRQADNVQALAFDINHTTELLNTIKDCDYVIWLVHASVPSTQDESLVDDFNINISPVIKFLEKAKQGTAIKKIIYLSSGGTVYGEPFEHFPVKENHPQSPISNYGLSKSITEKYIEYITYSAPYNSIILRPSNVFGKYQNLIKPQGIIGYAFKAIRDGVSLDLYDNGRVIRDFVYVTDLAKAVEKAMLATPEPGKTKFYNVGSNKGYSIKEVLGKIEEISGSTLMINHKSSRRFDCSYNVLDTSKIREELGWKEETALHEGLEKVWEWINC